MAFAEAQRDGHLARALRFVNRGEKLFKKVRQRPAVTYARAACTGCRGWILYKDDKYKDDKIDAAIETLKRAVNFAHDPEIYLHLALAYERKAERSKDDVERSLVIRRARQSCQRVLELKPTEDEHRAVAEMRQRLDRAGEAPQQAKAPRVGGSSPPAGATAGTAVVGNSHREPRTGGDPDLPDGGGVSLQRVRRSAGRRFSVLFELEKTGEAHRDGFPAHG